MFASSTLGKSKKETGSDDLVYHSQSSRQGQVLCLIWSSQQPWEGMSSNRQSNLPKVTQLSDRTESVSGSKAY